MPPTAASCPGSKHVLVETVNANLARLQVTIRNERDTRCSAPGVVARQVASKPSPSLLAVCVIQDAACSETTTLGRGTTSLGNQPCDLTYCRSTTGSAVEEMGFGDRPLRRAAGSGASLAVSFSSTLSRHEDQPPFMKVTPHGYNPVSFFNAAPTYRKRHGCANYNELKALGIRYRQRGVWVGFDDQKVDDPANGGLPECVFNVSSGSSSASEGGVKSGVGGRGGGGLAPVWVNSPSATAPRFTETGANAVSQRSMLSLGILVPSRLGRL